MLSALGQMSSKNWGGTWTRIHTGSYVSSTLNPAAPRIACVEVSAESAGQKWFTFLGSAGAYVSKYVAPHTQPSLDVSALSTLSND
jgi:hypothetical protein